MNHESLKSLLDDLYLRYKYKYSSVDPVWNLHKFSDSKDIEIIGLITSCYAYGQVNLINNFIGKLLNRIGNKPHEFTTNFTKRKDKKYLSGLGYRFHKDSDLIMLFQSLQRVLDSYGSLQNLFVRNFSGEHYNIIPALTAFSAELNHNVKNDNKRGKSYFSYLLPDPLQGSTCKRLMLYLRWMVRKDEIDFGIWKKIPPAKLIIPVDIHISRVAKNLKLVKRRSVDLKFALELTEMLKLFNKEDPVRYDFSLCHYQMEQGSKT
jgi:uncharacterized protein (TIGR02757 family)